MPSIPHFADLLENNEPPSDAILQEVSELCAIARNDLLQIDAEIQRLQEKRAVIQKSIDSYITISSPIRGLPTDILREIFYHCLDSTRNHIMSAAEAPMLLTHVCSPWRSVALTSPNMWAKLHIPLPGDPRVLSRLDSLSDEAIENFNQTFSEMMGRRCRAVKEWLARSGSCFLSLSISYPHYDTYFDGREGSVPIIEVESDTFTHEIFHILVSFVQRWRSLDLSMPSLIYQQLETRIPSKNMLSNLRTLRVVLDPNIQSGGNVSPPLLLLEAPNMRMFSLNAFQLTSASTILPPHLGGLLTDLCLDSYISDEDLLKFLQACHCLVNCQILVRAPFRRRHPSGSASVVCLPYLKKLKLFESSHLSPSLRLITAPSLTFFQYGNPRPSYNVITGMWFSLSGNKTMKWFIGNSSSTLRTLAITALNLCQKILPLLQLPVGIKCLHVFEWRDKLGPHVGTKFTDLSTLKVEYPTSDSPARVLFPNLEVLEVDHPCDHHDDELLQLFTSRIDAATRGDVSPLKWVKLHLSRREKKDIAEKVSAYARSVGIEMKFEVLYPPDLTVTLVPSKLHYIRHLSPSFLLPDPPFLPSF